MQVQQLNNVRVDKFSFYFTKFLGGQIFRNAKPYRKLWISVIKYRFPDSKRLCLPWNLCFISSKLYVNRKSYKLVKCGKNLFLIHQLPKKEAKAKTNSLQSYLHLNQQQTQYRSKLSINKIIIISQPQKKYAKQKKQKMK